MITPYGTTITTTSLEGALAPNPLAARTRATNVPAGTLPTENDVAALPVEKRATSLSPGDDPAEIRYAVGLPPEPGAFHANVTVDPLTLVTSRLGAPGAPGVGSPTFTVTSFEGGLEPAAVVARARMKYVPGLTGSAVIDVAKFPVEKVATSLPPENEPASITYDVGADAAAAMAVEGGASQNSVTDEPETELVKFIGAPGGDTT